MSNALDFSRGMPPTLSICNTESLGERIQATFPDVRVVKTLNTINANVMVNPSLVPGDHDVFLSGNDGDVPPAVVSAQGGVQDAEPQRACGAWVSGGTRVRSIYFNVRLGTSTRDRP